VDAESCGSLATRGITGLSANEEKVRVLSFGLEQGSPNFSKRGPH
jgi:hypothetical protein